MRIVHYLDPFPIHDIPRCIDDRATHFFGAVVLAEVAIAPGPPARVVARQVGLDGVCVVDNGR